ncbi:MAG: threonine--tRNA ligase [Actinobacteria bacterium]|nr:threonine--tRNA ligase [Actinomycetota bacterium]MCB8995886.1 threonine--tRNA ligase [Actinomycetota bacterium]MCB9415154.1 threonine--tRNA ligase [Actinomycetota bacterium]MCB9424603.1 threonine--tRNA ligase [Actinomycetota bacterium]HRY08493.1 threonine--tRNA ligase [Candidatus Nanopelagicales bacterium]
MSVDVIVSGDSRTVPAGTTAAEVLGDDRSVLVARVNGELKDLAYVVRAGDEIEPVRSDEPEGLAVLRHSTAHVLAQAVQDLFPDAKLGIGPPIKDGFYYDFGVEQPFHPDDLARIEKRMVQILKSGQSFQRRVVTEGEAQHELAAEPFKIELIGKKGGNSDEIMETGGTELTVYDNLDRTGAVCWSDLCRGPHVPSTKYIPPNAIKLMRSAAVYWLSDEHNPQLQRIYGTAWPSKDQLKSYLAFLEEAARRDHRKLGSELDLFSFPEEIGSGLAVFHPKGGIVRNVMEDYSRQRHIEAGYDFVNTPHVTKAALYEKSGHLDWYADGMYPPMDMDNAQYYLKPMNCPMHNLIYGARGRSYRELPLRLFEFGTVYRYEKSGVVQGLTRARGFTQDDAHIYCTREQMPAELDSLLTFVLDLLKDYGLTDFYLELSTRDPEKSIGTEQEWEEATAILYEAAKRQNLELVMDEGGAAFYGPKISVQATDAIGRTWQMSTIQVDFQMPQRFDMEYQAADGSRERPIMIHRALFGSIERFFAVLLEHYAGAFPPWLAPVTAIGIPVADHHIEYLEDVAGQLRAAGIRAEVDSSSDRMPKKIRNAQKQKVPYMLIAGDDDIAAGAVSFRFRDGEQRNGVPVAQAIAEIQQAVAEKRQV